MIAPRHRIVIGIALAIIAMVAPFAWRLWRGIAPAILPPSSPVRDVAQGDALAAGEGQNRTGLPLTLVPGLTLEVFAASLGAVRDLAFDPRGVLLASVPERGHIIALPDRNGDGRADEARVVVEGLTRPHGIAFLADGSLVVAEERALVRFAYDADMLRAARERTLLALPGGEGHGTRSVLVLNDAGGAEQLLVSTGSSCNVCVEDDPRRAAVTMVAPDGSGVRTFAKGLRNAVFLVLHPVTGAVWATEMGRDWLGDELPPDEVNILRDGADYGWPYCYGANERDPFGIERDVTCAERTPSHIALPAHVAPLGLAFVPEEGWPEEWWHDLIVAEHGSWNRTPPAGYELRRYDLAPDGTPISDAGPLITGWLAGRSASGRPVDILMLPGGVAYLSDDHAGVVYRMTVDAAGVRADSGKDQ